jgi:integral membrane protein
LRILGFFEGLSFVILVGVGMPLKYVMGEPLLVRVMGPIHGILFLWLCLLVLQAVFEHGWPRLRGGLVVLAALLPLGPFLIDGWLKRQAILFEK